MVAMLNKNQQYGKIGESLAVYHLKEKGYRILEQNHRNKLGEIDIIARDGESLVFVEVKSRRSDRFGSPKWAVTPAKQRKISMAALTYLKATGQLQAKARFDVVIVMGRPQNPCFEIIKNAFDLAYS